ncbi:hypothetical protein V1477_006279 [Vespula maculifrons]|uniref:Uncharacterized protein n=1 Tax=Vespula maculifrons TaxID=7453 RepID=A0ABD2CL44_VESMC
MKLYGHRARDEPFPITPVVFSYKDVFFLCSLKTVITRLLLVLSGREKYGRRGRDDPFPTTPKKILKEKCFLPLSHLICYNSAPIGPIWTKKIWA